VRTIGSALQRCVAAGFVAAVGASLGGGWGTAHAEPTARSVVLRASAQGVRVVYTVPDYVVVSQLFDGGGPVTQAEADSTGRATSFSALPYPGENAIAAPGVASVALGQSVPLAYPFYVRADHPTAPTAELKDPSGSYSLTANAADGTAAATAFLQGASGVSGTRSTTSTVLDDQGVVRAMAESVSTGISVGDGRLRIASVTTRSVTTLGPDDAKPQTVSSLLVEGASVAGHPVTIDANGVHAEKQTVPVPVGQGFSTENQLLGQAGISVRVVPAGVSGGADALVITSGQTFPAPGNPKGKVVMTFGGAVSEITVGSPEGINTDAELPAGPASDSGPGTAEAAAVSPAVGPLPSSASSTTLERASTIADELATPPATTAASGPELPIPAAVSNEIAAGVHGVPVQDVAGVRVEPDLGTTGALYALLGIGGVALVGTTRILRWRGAQP
jgi:hypothetical protein